MTSVLEPTALTCPTCPTCPTETKPQKGNKLYIAALVAQGVQQCSLCGQIKPLEAFSKFKYNRSGRRGQCGLCRSRQHGSFQFKAEADALAVQELKKCRQCLQVKSLDDFALQKSGRNGRSTRCLACAAIRKASGSKSVEAMTRLEMRERIKALEAILQMQDGHPQRERETT